MASRTSPHLAPATRPSVDAAAAPRRGRRWLLWAAGVAWGVANDAAAQVEPAQLQPASAAAVAATPFRGLWTLDGGVTFALANLLSQDVATRNLASLSTQSAPGLRAGMLRQISPKLGLQVGGHAHLPTFTPPADSSFAIDQPTQALWHLQAGVDCQVLHRWLAALTVAAERMLFVEASSTQLLHLRSTVGASVNLSSNVVLWQNAAWHGSVHGSLGLVKGPAWTQLGTTWATGLRLQRTVLANVYLGGGLNYRQRSQDSETTSLIDRVVWAEAFVRWQPAGRGEPPP